MYGYKDSKKPFYNDELQYKECTKCGKALHKSQFKADKTGIYGVYSRCKSCMTKESYLLSRKYRQTKNGKILSVKSAANLVFKQLNPEIKELPKIEEKTMDLFVILAQAEVEVAQALKDPKNKEDKLLTAKMFYRISSRCYNYYTKNI